MPKDGLDENKGAIIKHLNKIYPPGKNSFELMKLDHQSCLSYILHFENVKWTLCSILFPSIFIVLGLIVNNLAKIDFALIIILSFLSLSLIWTWVFTAVRMDVGQYLREEYIALLESKMLKEVQTLDGEQMYLNSDICHQRSFQILRNSQMPRFREIFSWLVSIFSTLSIWIIYYKLVSQATISTVNAGLFLIALSFTLFISFRHLFLWAYRAVPVYEDVVRTDNIWGQPK
jgi:ABC-type transport system involved in cytochrome bd biosynthesis fused ATPase/permease subunit